MNVYSRATESFAFHPGPIFANIVIADEINRADPKVQSALLEAMGEGQVSVDGQTHHLEQPFIVVATQNPIELEGTYPLPEAQLDRFMIRMGFGYPVAGTEERMVMSDHASRPLEGLHHVAERHHDTGAILYDDGHLSRSNHLVPGLPTNRHH